MQLRDYLSECIVEFKGSEEDFGRAFCRRCSQPECERSLVNTGAAARKLKKNQRLAQFVRAEAAPRKPLPVVAQQIAESEVVERSVVPEGEEEQLELEERGDRRIHKAPLEPELSDGEDLPNIGAQLAVARQELKNKPVPESTPTPQQEAAAPQLPEPAPQLPPVPSAPAQEHDPWALPLSNERHIDYREKSAAEDPWSKEYAGPREIHAKPGEKITV